MALVNISIFGAKEAEYMFERGALRANNMKPALDNVADDIMEVVGKVFDSQGRRSGGSWAWLQTATVRRKAKAGMPEPNRILYGWGELRASVTDPDNEFNLLDVTSRSIHLGSDLPYAAAHQYGNDHVPARPYLKFDHWDVERWAGMCVDSIVEAMSITR